MPLLDIATAKSYFQTNILPSRTRTLLQNRFVFGDDKRFAYGWNLFQVPKKKNNFYMAHVGERRSVLQTKAVATLEPKCSVHINGEKDGEQNQWPSVGSNTLEKEQEYSGYESEEPDDKEKLRRMRISKANSGKTPWNKGRKHSEETKQRIKERTRIAMQTPKVKMKLANIGHAQSIETRVKIGISVRTTWERRREKLIVQERCHFEWQNLIAEASRRGFCEEAELQWNSYEVLDEELEQEFLESVEQRKNMPKVKGNRRAPKSLEQRRKIAAAVAAKWADPVYRDKVCSALSKYHGSPSRAERQPRKRSTNESPRQPRTPRPIKKKANSKPTKTVKGVGYSRVKLRRRNVPLYKDPLANSKLEMIKNIRAQRVPDGTKKSRAIQQAKLLIAEAEKAAKALEAAAISSPLARASLIETRNLIAEAIQSIQSIEILQVDSCENDLVQTNNRGINGIGELSLEELTIGEIEDPSTRFSVNGVLNNKDGFKLPGINGYAKTKESTCEEKPSHREMNGHSKHDRALVHNRAHFSFEKQEMNPKSISVSKKWICGRLVDVVEGDTVGVQ